METELEDNEIIIEVSDKLSDDFDNLSQNEIKTLWNSSNIDVKVSIQMRLNANLDNFNNEIRLSAFKEYGLTREVVLNNPSAMERLRINALRSLDDKYHKAIELTNLFKNRNLKDFSDLEFRDTLSKSRIIIKSITTMTKSRVLRFINEIWG